MARDVMSFGNRLELDLRVGDRPPRSAGVLVVPQDVHLILGDVVTVEDTRETPEQVLAACGEERTPRTPGSILVAAPARRGAPLLVQAIVYDFARSPPAREEDVFEALLAAFEEARARSTHGLALLPLGTAHSGLEPGRFLRVLAQVCYSAAELGTSVRQVHLLLPSRQELQRYEGLLQALLAGRRRAVP
jgi:O-acetyl-ADP-ribose deacetylase (regulator of RNase III)